VTRYVGADVAGLFVFTTVGLISHGFEPAGYLRDFVPFTVAWLAVGFAVGLYRDGSRARLLVTWIVAVPAAWLVRALALEHAFDGDELAFLLTSLAFTLVFVGVARMLAAAVPAAA
jgi:hypothetical protein